MLITYSSFQDFVRVARDKRHVNESWYRENKDGGKWYGFMTFANAVRFSDEGDTSLVPRAEKLMDQLNATVEVRRPQWEPSVAGAWVSVPEYLAGEVECFRTMESVACETAPVRIVVATSCSAGISADQMLQRGVAILALLMRLEQVRPVSLSLLAETHGQTDGEYLQLIPIESQPLNLSVACHAIANVGFARQLTYAVAIAKDGFNGSWPRAYEGGGARWESHVREVLGLEADDLYIGAARAWDEALTNPVKWVNDHLERLAGNRPENW